MLRRLIAILFALIVLGGAAFAIVGVVKGDRKPVPRPGTFYRLTAILPHGAPGTVIRSEPLTGLRKGVVGWRVMYLTHGYDELRTAVTGMILAPAGHRTNRNIVVFAHPMVGVASRCGPSVYGADYTPYVDGLRRLLAAGDVVSIPDYQGLGSVGPHPFLIGEAVARTVIDAARAAHKFAPAGGGKRYAVLGSSQGGQAAV